MLKSFNLVEVDVSLKLVLRYSEYGERIIHIMVYLSRIEGNISMLEL